MQRSQARSLTLIAQISTMGLVALVAFVAVAGVPGLSAPAAGIPPMPEPEAIDQNRSEGGEREFALRIEVDPIIERFKSLPNAPKVIEQDESKETVKGTGTPPSPSLVAFLGAVIAANHRAAMLQTDGEKVWVAQGETGTVGGRSVRVLEVQADHVRVEIDGAERRLARAPRSGSAVASISRTQERLGGNDLDFSARRRGLEDARTEMLRSGGQDPLQARRNSANAMLERAAEMEETDPQAAKRLRDRAQRLLSINPGDAGSAGGSGGSSGQDPER